MSRISRAFGGAISIAACIACAAPAGAGTATYWGPHGGVATVHTPGPYVRPVPGPCCYAPWRGAGAVAAGVAAGAAIGAATHPYPYPYGYPYPVYVAPRPVVYPPAIIVAPAPAYVYPARPVP
ncbi:hypothetical protein [Acidomonas methanolica]|uniref:Uncharacterized protein n=1 Tax=Acidomonas methanolica NBRC 104435 TaxID=1231351 RepID=A0A023D366_ACIMT|nr:hypothetical protein [Acidomonas methanolica]MBU2654081.1 hypothetical protein [Acidomonas methanolica]TCS30690.1 hypothetical protein EDC31_105123 [Acidomonas methanolica]GAJ28180.1 hypothetical protein Amme_015_047 [Acidomonas methanolica NBRC 104435]GBQ49855.1 hypothetical protein AA0498_1085 [Acidomonas methanolica]GEK98922.1 hypothetical protein AME01nite_14210 [Acidomonas methanolica NBRC 104435]